MNMYFAKYLPVEGEIKEVKSFEEACERCEHMEIFKRNNKYYQIFFGPEHDSECETKVPEKLFLCSRDIQVGDKMTWLVEGLSDYDCPGIITDEVDIAIAKEKSQWCFKVTGEIRTPNIKEGQEFNEEETNYLTIT